MTSTQIKILAVLGALVGILAIFTAVVFALDPGDSEPKSAASLPTATSAVATIPPTAVTAVRGTPSPAAASPAQTPAVSPTPARAGVVVRAPMAVNIRRGPGTEFPIIVTLSAGDELPATGRVQDGSWLFVTLRDGTGWVALDVVEVINGAAASLPVVPAPTPPPAPPPTSAPAAPASRPPVTGAPAASPNPGVGPIRTAPPPPPSGPATRIPTVPPP